MSTKDLCLRETSSPLRGGLWKKSLVLFFSKDFYSSFFLSIFTVSPKMFRKDVRVCRASWRIINLRFWTHTTSSLQILPPSISFDTSRKNTAEKLVLIIGQQLQSWQGTKIINKDMRVLAIWLLLLGSRALTYISSRHIIPSRLCSRSYNSFQVKILVSIFHLKRIPPISSFLYYVSLGGKFWKDFAFINKLSERGGWGMAGRATIVRTKRRYIWTGWRF